ncbi:DUF362 domain-containing protein [Candidatus Latescibacterota bacterium]
MRMRTAGIITVAIGALVAYDLVKAAHLEVRQDVPPDVTTLATPLVNSTVSVVRSDYVQLAAPAAPDQPLTSAQIKEMVWTAIELAPTKTGPLPSIIAAGRWVVVKPNMVYIPPQSRDYSLGDITDPRVVRAVLEYLAEFTVAGRITLAMGGSWKGVGSPDLSYDGGDVKQGGVVVDGFTVSFGDDYPGFVGSYRDVLDSLAGQYPDKVFDTVDFNYDIYPSIEEATRVPVPIYNGIQGFSADEYFVSNTILNADVFISVPTMKVHDIPGVSLSHKNYVGTQSRVVNGTSGWWNSRLHSQPGGMDQVIADLVSYHPPDYAIIGTIWGMEGQGPHISQGGKPIRLNMVVASPDPVSADAVATTIMGFNPYDIGHLRNSAAKGFGILDMDYITVRGDPIEKVQVYFEKPALQGSGISHYYGRANREWLLNGVYEGADLDFDFLGGEASVRPLEGEAVGGQVWQLMRSGTDVVDLKFHYNAENGVFPNDAVSYAFAYIYSEIDQDGYLWIGSDDGVRVWLNGDMVLDNPESGSHRLAEDKVPVSLLPGENRLLVKVKNTLGNYAFSVAVVDEDGDTLPRLSYYVDTPTYVAESQGDGVPTSFALEQNAPNPFNSDTIIRFALSESQEVRLEVYNLLGQRVATLAEGWREAGQYRVRWDGRDDGGQELASGVYAYRLVAGERATTRKLVLTR